MNRTRNDRRRGTVRSLFGSAVVMAACALAEPVSGQLISTSPTPRPTAFVDDLLFVNTGLAEHTPRAVTGFRLEDGVTGHLMAVTTEGVAYRKFHTKSRVWSSWTFRSNPTGVPTDLWDISMPLVRSSAMGANVIDGFFGYLHGMAGMMGMPGATDVPLSTDFGTLTTGGYFHAETAIAYMEGSGPTAVQRFRVFGNSSPDGDPDGAGNLDSPLLRIDGNGSDWTFADPTKPVDSRAVILGPQSACAIHLGGGLHPRHMVFGTATYSGLDKVALHYWNGSSWSWKDLGAPYPYTQIVSAPLVVYRYDNPSYPPQVNVFIVAREKGSSSATGRFQLFEKYWNGAITGSPSLGTEQLVWGGWNNYRHPVDGSGAPLLEAGTKFFFTSGNVWKNGSTLRVDLFGHSNNHTNPQGVPTPGQLYRFYWDGFGWSWDHAAGAPDGEGFRTTSSFVVEDGPGYDRVAVVGRTRTGRIYERYYQVVNGVQSGWTWNNLSLKPVYTSRF